MCYCNRHLKTKTKSFLLQYPSLVAQRLKRLTAMWETWVRSLGQEDSPGEGNGNPPQYSCLENPMDGGAWRAAVHGVAKSLTRLSNFTHFSPSTVKSISAATLSNLQFHWGLGGWEFAEVLRGLKRLPWGGPPPWGLRDRPCFCLISPCILRCVRCRFKY